MSSTDAPESDISDSVLEKTALDLNLGPLLNPLGKYLNSRGAKSPNTIDDAHNSHMAILTHILSLISSSQMNEELLFRSQHLYPPPFSLSQSLKFTFRMQTLPTRPVKLSTIVSAIKLNKQSLDKFA